MGSIFGSLGDLFNPVGWLQGKSGGANSGFNTALDFLDPGNTFHTGSAQRNAQQQWQLEYDLAKKNYDEQVRMNNENIRMQQEAFDYQKQLNDLQIEREDNAVFRRVADLKASGLSPTLAAGSAAGATPVHAGTAPQGVAPQMSSPSAIKAQAAMFGEQMRKENMSLAMSMLGNIADVSRTMAETKLIDAQANQVSTMTPIDYKLKEQAYEFADKANVHKLKGLALDVTDKEKNIDLKNWDLILSQDKHAQNALNYYTTTLDAQLKAADISLKDREYILKGLAIDAAITANARADLEYQNLQFDTKFYHGRGLPLGFNPGYGGLLSLGTMDTWQGVQDKWNAGKDFVSRIYNAAKKSAHKFTFGAFDYSNK